MSTPLEPTNEVTDLPEPAGDGSERRRPSRAGRGGSLLELALLGVLADGPQHGYELKKRLDAVLPAWSSVSFGSLYPTLGRLERAGDLVAARTDDTGTSDDTTENPLGELTDDLLADTAMTGTLSGELAAFRARLRDRAARPGRPRRTSRNPRGQRGRKAYSITPAGTARLHELLISLDPADDRAFTLQVAFAAHLDTAERLAVFARRRSELVTRLDAAAATPPPQDTWRNSLRRHAMAAITADIDWVDALLAGERTLAADESPERPPADVAGTTTGGTR